MGPKRERRGIAIGLALAALFPALALAAVPAAAPTSIAVAVTSDLTVVSYEDLVTFTISMEVGPNLAREATVGVSLPAPLVYLSDTADALPQFEARTTSVDAAEFRFRNLPPKAHGFELQALVERRPAPTGSLTVSAEVDFTDNAGVPQPIVHGEVSVVLTGPLLTATFLSSAAAVDPGDSLAYVVRVENVGDAHARDVWLNVSLPAQVSWFGNVPSAPCATLICQIVNIPRGGSRGPYDVVVNVSASAPRGTSFTARLHVDYRDQAGAPQPGIELEATVQVRRLGELAVDKVVGAPIASPGGDVTYTIWYNNSETSANGAVWINDTLPTGLSYVSSTPPASVSGQDVRWTFASIPPGPNFVRIRAVVDTGTPDDAILVNLVGVDHLDATGTPAARLSASAVLTVDASVIGFSFAKVAGAGEAGPGASVPFTLYYNNTGMEPSALVVIRDQIPPGTVLTESTAAFSASGRLYEWRFSDVAPGNYSLAYTLVLTTASGGANLVNTAWLNATDAGGLPRVTLQQSETVRVASDAPGGIPLFLLVALAVSAAGGLLGYAAYVRRSRTVIDEVFLLHKDGLLIKHYTRRVRPDVDSDVLSGMLIAVQNFVNESFLGANGLAKDGKLDEMSFGAFKIVIERGQSVIVAAILSSDPSNRIKAAVKAAIVALEGEFGEKLATWEGDMRSVEGVDRYMQDLIAGRYRG